MTSYSAYCIICLGQFPRAHDNLAKKKCFQKLKFVAVYTKPIVWLICLFTNSCYLFILVLTIILYLCLCCFICCFALFVLVNKCETNTHKLWILMLVFVIRVGTVQSIHFSCFEPTNQSKMAQIRLAPLTWLHFFNWVDSKMIILTLKSSKEPSYRRAI